MSRPDPSSQRPPSTTPPLSTPATEPLAETMIPSNPLPDSQLPPTCMPGADASNDATLPPTVPVLPVTPAAGVTVPGYQILGELGRGGMGVVYRARQIKANRLVALKMILAGAHASADDLQRFQVEAEAVARLRHANIVSVYDVGEHNGLPFFSLEFCGGGSLEKKLRGTPLKPGEAAPLVEALARAMATAHAQRVIHRDLKPANVLLLEDGTPKITDFGLAKKLDDTSGQTQSGSIMGTPSYMAPEQASGKVHEVGPAADVYALGAVLYELLTGRPPFKAATPLDTVLQVISDEPVPPSQLNPKTPRDLETICLKCLQKEPARRYGSALDLAEDLRRFQAGEPITARPVGRLERAWRWCKRKPGVASLALALVLVAAVGFALVTWLWLDAVAARDESTRLAEQEKKAKKDALDAKGSADEQRRRAEAALERAETALYFNRIRRAEEAVRGGNATLAEKILDECRLDLRRWEWHLLRRGAGLDGIKLAGEGAVNGLAFSPDCTTLATAGADKTLRLWDAATGKPRGQPVQHPAAVSAVAFHPDGRQLATGCADGLVRLWEVGSVREPRLLTGHTDPVLTLAYSADGRWLASGSKDFTAMLWPLPGGQEPRTLGGHSNAVAAVAFSPDSKILVTAGLDGTVKLWQVANGRLLRTLRGHSFGVTGAAFADGGKQVVTGSLDGTVRVWETDTGKTLQVLRGNQGGAAVHGTRIAAPAGPQVKLWDAVSGQEVLTLAAPGGRSATQVVFSPSGRRLAAVWIDPRKPAAAEVRIWDATPRPERFAVHPRSFGLTSAALTSDGRLLATAGFGILFQTGGIQLWDTATGLEVLSAEGHAGAITCVAFRPDGRRLATGGADHSLMIWDAATGKSLLTITGHKKPVQKLTWSPDGKRLLSVAADGQVRLHDPESGKELLALPGHDPASPALAFSADGKRFAAVGARGEVFLRDSERGQTVATLSAGGHLIAVAFSPDGRHLATVGPGTAVRLWEIASGRVVLNREAAGAILAWMTFDGAGKELSVLSPPGRARVWAVPEGKLLRSETYPPGPGGRVLTLGRRFAVTMESDGTVRVWNRPDTRSR